MYPNCRNGYNSESGNSAWLVVCVLLIFPVIVLVFLQRWPPVCWETVIEGIWTYLLYPWVQFHRNQRTYAVDISQVVHITEFIPTAVMDVTVNQGIRHDSLYVCCQYLTLSCCYPFNIGHLCVHKQWVLKFGLNRCRHVFNSTGTDVCVWLIFPKFYSSQNASQLMQWM